MLETTVSLADLGLCALDVVELARRVPPEGGGELDARIASYDLAARMQLSATSALDIDAESEETRRLYGLDDETTASYGRRCLMARRLVERGVRFIQIFMEDAVWDHHSQINAGQRVPRSALEPGDLVFFYSGVSHVGLYIGGGRMIHAPHPGAPVRVAPISEMPFAGATRPV